MKDIYNFKIYLRNRVKLPDFVRGSYPLNHEIYVNLTRSIDVILKLATTKVVGIKRVKVVQDEFNEYVDAILYHIEPEHHVFLAIYYMHMVEDFMIECEKDEQFEVCANLKKFYDLYMINDQE